MSEKRFRYDSSLEKVYDDNTYNGEYLLNGVWEYDK